MNNGRPRRLCFTTGRFVSPRRAAIKRQLEALSLANRLINKRNCQSRRSSFPLNDEGAAADAKTLRVAKSNTPRR
ncbi:unnamed protein product, partial [Iphiclides podalirius]